MTTVADTLPRPRPLPSFNRHAIKLLILGVAWIFLGMLLATISGLISERHGYRDQAESSIAAGWGGAQLVGAPLLRFSFAPQIDAKGFERRIEDRWVLADVASIDTELASQTRKLGIFEIPVYESQMALQAQFSAERIEQMLAQVPGQTVERVALALPVGDPRGLRAAVSVKVGKEQLRLVPSGAYVGGHPVLSADLNDPLSWQSGLQVDQQIALAGVGSLRWLPTASDLSVELHGDWPDPGFADGLLPRNREVGDQGFSADWRVLDFNAGVPPVMNPEQLNQLSAHRVGFGVTLQQPGEVYQRNERAWKYGFLFVALSLGAYFLLELLLSRELWALDYGLIGVSQVVFYLLLLALSEHLGFDWAYAISALVFAVMVGAFSVGLLGSRGRGMVAGTLLAVAYAMLYLLIGSESYALLLGALLATALVALAMALVSRARGVVKAQGPGMSAQESA
ncbi:MAG: inner membrane CreD family protein [Xanthomonadales bacterium]|nr:inner membrane CreD family protein [Xanthomonadales bacterium]